MILSQDLTENIYPRKILAEDIDERSFVLWLKSKFHYEPDDFSSFTSMKKKIER